MDYTVHGVTKSQTRLRDFHFRYQVLLAKCPVKQKVFSIFFLRSSGVKKKNHETFRKDLIFGRSPNHFRGIPGGSAMQNLPAMQEMQETVSIPGSARSPGGGNGNPLQYCCLENPKDRGAWQATAVYSPWGCKVSHKRATNTFTLIL